MRAERLALWLLALAAIVGSPAQAQHDPSAPEAPPAEPRLRTVVIDPGHGGDDTGTVGTLGVTEAQIVMAVGHQIGRIFEQRLGTQRIVLTRHADANVPIPARISTANGSKGDILVSLHVAASSRPEARGPRVYSMGAGLRIVELVERRLRPRARRLLGDQPPDAQTDLRLTPWALAQAEFATRSAALAQSVARELREAASSEVPVQALPLAILAGARMPAIVVELGHVTSSEDEELLQNDRYQRRLAGALFRGITSFALPGALAAQDRAATAAPPPDDAPIPEPSGVP